MSTSSVSPTLSSRRDFFRRTGLLSFAAAAVPALVPSTARAAAKMSTDTTDDPIYMSTTKLAGLIREKKISASEAVQLFIKRQEHVNDRLNAVVMNCYERAVEEAKALDEKAARGEWVGPLHGVPITIKDSLDTEGVISTGATFGRQQFVPKKDATVVSRVRKNGAILLGKTNTPEFTLGGLGGINAASNLLYGASHNPYDLTRSTAGSSGGAGAIVAAGGSSFDIGSDWGGSIRGPAHNNGIVGIKPTSVRVPRTGHIVDFGGVFDLFQQLGPLARRVEDIALITPLIAGPDYHDAACSPVPWADPDKVDLKKLNVAFCTMGGAATDKDTKDTVRQVAQWLQDVTASIKEDYPKEVIADLAVARTKLTSGDGGAYYQRLADKWGTKNISPQRKASMATGHVLSSADMVEAWEDHDLAKSRMLDWMKAYDVFICPVATKPAQPIDADAADRPGAGGTAGARDGYPTTATFNCTGWPVVVVRCGTSTDGNNLPIGVQVVCAPWREDICIAVASYLETKSGGWKRPPV